MKKIFTFIVLFVVSLYSMAQTPFFYEWKNGYCTRRYLSDVDSITFDSNQKPFDSTTYDRLGGAWKMEVVSDYDGPLTFDVTVLTDEEGGSAYEKYCFVTGLSGYSFMIARLDCHFDESTGEGYVAFPMPYVSVEGVNFGSFVGDIHLYGVSEDNQLYSSAEIRGVWNDDMSEITFEAAPKMGMVVVNGNGHLYGWWDRFVVVKMVRSKMKYNAMNLALSGGKVCSDNSVAITPNEVITTSIKRAETAFMDSSVNNWRPDTFEVAYKDNTKNETKDDVATVNMDKEWRTSTAGAQSQYFYEWKNGACFQRSLAEVDSITFSLPAMEETPIVGAWSNGGSLIKFNADGTGTIEEEGEVLPFGYTFNSSTSVVTITSGVFWEEEIKQIKIKFISDNIIQLGWWIDGEWYFEEDEKYYRQDGNEAKVNKVDLGLPSGTLWADRNVGADSPEAYGDYFAWGETEPKSAYTWDTYKWCNGSYNTLTKYCYESTYGTEDNKTTLDLVDDAAYVNMGKDWRMPTETQMNELNSKCTWTWTTQNGTKGCKVTGPNGNSIFLPAAGARYDGSLGYAGSYGCYWSASLDESYSDSAWYLGFSSSDHGAYNYVRTNGLLVRAVAR